MNKPQPQPVLMERSQFPTDVIYLDYFPGKDAKNIENNTAGGCAKDKIDQIVGPELDTALQLIELAVDKFGRDDPFVRTFWPQPKQYFEDKWMGYGKVCAFF